MKGVRFPIFCLLGCPHHKADCFVHITPKWILHVTVSPFPRMSLFSGVCLCPSKHSFLMPFPFRAITALFAAQASCPAFYTCILFFCYKIYLLCWRWRQQVVPKWWYISAKLHGVASLRTVIFTQKLNYLLGFYDLKLFYLCSANRRQGETWPWSPLSRRGGSICGQTSYGQQPQQEQVRATPAG